MPQSLAINDFLFLPEKQVLLDVRSESEFAHAHIPGAVNLPLLNDENRKIVGTIYKQQGREAAISKGFELVGPLFGKFYADAQQISGDKMPVFYCWRGGMRSHISASVCEWGGRKTTILKGGYKAYRTLALRGFEQKLNLQIVSGFTGVGKTEILELLQKDGAQTIDLEKLANHKGSVLGALGMPAQFSNEMFENLLFEAWRKMDVHRPVFMENESRKIGANVLPELVWNQMENADKIEINVPRKVRLERILKEYGNFATADLAYCNEKIKKRLGGLNLKLSLEALHAGNISGWAEILMDYYDRTYAHSRKDKPNEKMSLDWDWNAPENSLKMLLEIAEK